MASKLEDELVGLTANPCKLCVFLSGLAPEEAADWHRLLRYSVRQVGNTAVVRALARRNVDINERSVRRHRSKHEQAREVQP